MKRFYKAARAVELDSGHGVELDGRGVRTPARAILCVPARSLAQAIADEWNAQGDEIEPRAMVMTGLSNGAIDQIAPDPAAFARGIAVYGESDLLCYRADHPDSLVAMQQRSWNPVLDWAEGRYGVTFALATGVMHVPQPEETLATLARVVADRDPFTLAGLSTLVTLSGSLVIGLAALENAFPAETLWRAAELDELYQAEQWGEDDLAARRRAERLREFDNAVRFLRHLND